MSEEETVIDVEADSPAPSLAGRIIGLPMVIVRRPLMGVGVLTVASVAGVLWYMWTPSSKPIDPVAHAAQQLERAFDHLRNDQIQRAREIAAPLREDKNLETQHRWGPSYVLGVAMAKDAESQWNTHERKLRFRLAARYLDESRRFGFPSARQLDGYRWLGQSRFAAGRFEEAIPPLSEAVQLAVNGQFELRRQLSQAYLRKTNPDLKRALENALLQQSAARDEQQKHLALVDIADLQVRLGQLRAAIQSVDQIPKQTKVRAWKYLIQGRVKYRLGLRENAKDATDRLQQAIAAFREAAKYDPTAQQATRLSHLFRGLCFAAMKDHKAAEAQFGATRELDEDSDEGIAGAIYEADMQRLMGAPESMASYRSVIRKIHHQESFPSLWIQLADFRAKMLAAYDDYLTNKDFQHAVELAAILPPLVRKDAMLKLEAKARRQWAQDLFDQAKIATDDKRDSLKSEGRQQMRFAGQAFDQLARQLRTTRDYPQALWNSAQSFLEGNDFKNASSLTKQYLATIRRQERPRALVALGRANLALANLDIALQAVNECIEFHAEDPAVYSARLIASKIYLEKGRIADAANVLNKNLDPDGPLDPRSEEWRDSLFAIGRIHYLHGMKLAAEASLKGVHRRQSPQEQKQGLEIMAQSVEPFDAAAKALSLATRRYKNTPHTILATYMAGDARRHIANYLRYRREIESIEITRRDLTKQIQNNLKDAVRHFAEVIHLIKDNPHPQMDALTQRVLRNSYFNRADALFGLDDYSAAERAYGSVVSKYREQPITLEALVQMARCHRRLSNFKKASGSIEQAKIILHRIGDKGNFKEATRFTNYKDWEDLLQLLTKTYNTKTAPK